MSFYPVKPNFSVPSTTGLVTYQGRINLGRVAAQTTTPLVGGAFTVPALFGSVTINVVSSASFLVGDTIGIGERLGAYTTGAGPLTNPITFSAYRPGSWRSGTNVQTAGYTVLSPNGSTTTVTTAAWTIPVFASPTATSLNVVTPANVQTSSKVVITNYAGVFKVTAKPSATTMTIQKVIDGDLPAGATCIAGDTNVFDGTMITQGTLLGTVPRIGTTQFYPLDVWYTPITSVAPAGSGLVFGVGFSPNSDSGRAAFCDITRSTGILTSGSLSTSQYTEANISTTSPGLSQRLAASWGLPVFLTVDTPASLPGTYVLSVTVRGFLSEIS